MFNVPPIRDVSRNIQLRKLKEVNAVEPVAPFPRIEKTGHRSDEPDRPDAIDERLRNDKNKRKALADNGSQDKQPARQEGSDAIDQQDDGQHQLDEYA
ncbi:hypothetical protein LRD18_00675 [Halorhodospira halochloris]|uniref:Uncharacterized protein n=1 Tax=Halorhodospira halochloris TaxID=1052 RepID=A0A110B4A2_HALHR|nr:hypothetical protein [Halorhodospira halochloris]MBK1651019.1 hypothetical protein [Halorhodospira halochloris]MCG5529386.1 hypothetical protein [Halorhodospira halochloris]MCG5547361.1 hypothetical protein [Halorhodospira halochloris]BAU56470.1 hypothetical protein HH1059_23990 [Halorhodospira halochloris]